MGPVFFYLRLSPVTTLTQQYELMKGDLSPVLFLSAVIPLLIQKSETIKVFCPIFEVNFKVVSIISTLITNFV